jgi:hypothetical protein
MRTAKPVAIRDVDLSSETTSETAKATRRVALVEAAIRS